MSGLNFTNALGAPFCILGALLIFKIIRPNRRFGLITPKTLENPITWYRAHRALGWVFLVTGIAIVIFSLWPDVPAHPATGFVALLLDAAAFVFVYRRYAA